MNQQQKTTHTKIVPNIWLSIW